MPRCASLPSQLFSPPSISRSECARPNWQNSMATNWLQLDKPLLRYSAPGLLDHALEVDARDQLEYLAEHAA